MAKRYLTAVDKDYYEGLSETSKRTLKYQVRSPKTVPVVPCVDTT